MRHGWETWTASAEAAGCAKKVMEVNAQRRKAGQVTYFGFQYDKFSTPAKCVANLPRVHEFSPDQERPGAPMGARRQDVQEVGCHGGEWVVDPDPENKRYYTLLQTSPVKVGKKCNPARRLRYYDHEKGHLKEARWGSHEDKAEWKYGVLSLDHCYWEVLLWNNGGNPVAPTNPLAKSPDDKVRKGAILDDATRKISYSNVHW
jgi:hypothetical protein